MPKNGLLDYTVCSKCPSPTLTHALSLLVKLSTALLIEFCGNSSLPMNLVQMVAIQSCVTRAVCAGATNEMSKPITGL